ncbi:MAG TPA: hypothetical protein EYP10_13115, partial [Armatimonadetes bacterium]|nr:hypothetical protein [Armatimonadota bacterium]
TVRVIEGDITELDVDAIVNAGNTNLTMSGGVAGAIKKKGGVEIEAEAKAQAPINIGDAVITNAGTLKAKYVIHGAVMGADRKTDANKVRKTTESCLRVFQDRDLNSIAFPAFGTGVGGLSYDESAQAMLGAVREYADKLPEGATVIFVLFGSEAYEAFARALERL